MSEAAWLLSDTQKVLAVQGLETVRVQFVDCSVGKVVVKGQRAARPAWRFAVLNALARLLDLQMLRAVPAPGGATQQATEVARLQALREAGIDVPQVHWVGPDRFAMAYLSEWSLSHEWHANRASAQQQFSLWQAGAHALMAVHERGQVLSQGFARNALWLDGKVWFIDFEDDPLAVMPIAAAQVRDWLAYLHSSVYILTRNHPFLRSEMLSFLNREMPETKRPDQVLWQKAMRTVSWLRFLPTQRWIMGRDIVAAQALGGFVHDWLKFQSVNRP